MSESVSVVDKIIAGLVEWPADSRRLDPAGVSAAAKALHMWEHGDPTDYADPDYRECVEVAVSAYLAVAGSPADENPWRTSFPPGRLDTALKAEAWDEGFAAGIDVQQEQINRTVPKIAADAWDNGRAAENARIVAALRAKGTHAADVLADQIEAEAP